MCTFNTEKAAFIQIYCISLPFHAWRSLGIPQILEGLIYDYCRTYNVSVCLYVAYIACGSVSLYIKTLYFLLIVLALSAAAAVATIKIRYDAKIPQFAIFGTRIIYVFYSISIRSLDPGGARINSFRLYILSSLPNKDGYGILDLGRSLWQVSSVPMGLEKITQELIDNWKKCFKKSCCLVPVQIF